MEWLRRSTLHLLTHKGDDMTVAPLPADITVKGLDQASLVTFLQNLRDVVNELVDDHATNRTSLTEMETLIEELAADHATTKATLDAARTAIIELSDDHDTNQTHFLNIKTLLNTLRTAQLYATFGNPTFAIDTNFDVKSTEIVYYTNGGTLKTLADNTNFDTGTSKTIASSQWAAGLLTVNSSGTGVVTWTADAASEAAAIALLAAPGATDTPMGYVTVNAHASGFTAGTDALTTGTGGNVATATNYYNSINPNAAVVGAAVSTSAESALAASDPAAGPATLTAATTITAPAATLTNATDLTLSGG